jgi:hypothetical protein
MTVELVVALVNLTATLGVGTLLWVRLNRIEKVGTTRFEYLIREIHRIEDGEPRSNKKPAPVAAVAGAPARMVTVD